MDFVNPPFAFVLVDGVLAPKVYRKFYRSFAEAIELQGDETVLEFGCGSGGISEHLAPRLKSGSLLCLDISPPMLRIAKKRLARYVHVRFLAKPIGDAELHEASIDVIAIHNAFHDLPVEERERTAAVLASLLKPGGRLCFREPTKPSHGLPPDVYRSLMIDAGLIETGSVETSLFPIGPVFQAEFRKPD